MIEGFILTAQQVGILFALVAAGLVCRRLGLFTGGFVKGCGNLLLLAVTPCLIVHVFQRPFSPEALSNLGFALAAAVFAHVLGIVFAELFFSSNSRNAVKIACLVFFWRLSIISAQISLNVQYLT